MTQMMLFDPPAASAASFTPACASAVATPPAENVAPAKTLPESPLQHPSDQVRGRSNHQRGVHHMGDLARLVLLRYELVAKRKAILAARKAR